MRTISPSMPMTVGRSGGNDHGAAPPSVGGANPTEPVLSVSGQKKHQQRGTSTDKNIARQEDAEAELSRFHNPGPVTAMRAGPELGLRTCAELDQLSAES